MQIKLFTIIIILVSFERVLRNIQYLLLTFQSLKNYQPIKTADDNRLTTRTTHSDSEFLLIIITTVVEVLKNFSLFTIRHNTFVAACRHDRGTPTQGIGRTRVFYKLTLHKMKIAALGISHRARGQNTFIYTRKSLTACQWTICIID